MELIRRLAVPVKLRPSAVEANMQTIVSMRRILMACACIAAAIGFTALRSGRMSAYPAAAQAAPANLVRDFVTTYCVTCHNRRLKTRNLTLDNADIAHVFNAAEAWENVVA